MTNLAKKAPLFALLMAAVMHGGCGVEPVEGPGAPEPQVEPELQEPRATDLGLRAFVDALPADKSAAVEEAAEAQESDPEEAPGEDLDAERTAEKATAISASSNVVVNTGGTRAGEAWFDRGSPARFALYDAKCDAHPVYIEYQIDGGSTQRVNNNDGCGETVLKNLQSGDFTIRYRVCVNIQLAPDVCSKYMLDHN